MDYELQFKIYKDKKLANYLKENSEWYKHLNRSNNNYKYFLKGYKKYNREMSSNKFNTAIDTIDTVNSILKIIN
ncbi:MAG: hypothetical protein PHF21_01415 [Bacilli bacterium]|nr:hypothetical protein [Bacilli bacterium]